MARRDDREYREYVREAQRPSRDTPPARWSSIIVDRPLVALESPPPGGAHMNQHSRREILRGGLAVAGLSVIGIPEWVLPALAAERDARPVHRHPRQRAVGHAARSPAARRPHDRRPVHAEGQVLDDAALRPSDGRHGHLQAEDLRARRPADAALARRPEEDGRARISSPASSAPATAGRCRGCAATASGPACRCKTVLDAAGVKAAAREFVFFGADQGRGRSRVAHAEIQDRPAVRPQPQPREGAVGRAVPRLGAERRAAHASIRARRCGCSSRAGTASRT